MRVAVALVLVGLSLCGPGCALLTDSAKTLCHYVADSVEDAREGFRNRHWAELAWKDLSAAEPDAAFAASLGAVVTRSTRRRPQRSGFAERMSRPTSRPDSHLATKAGNQVVQLAGFGGGIVRVPVVNRVTTDRNGS